MLSLTRRRLVQYRLTSRHNLAVSKSTSSKTLYPENEKYQLALQNDRDILLSQTNKLRFKMIRKFSDFWWGFTKVYILGTALCIAGLTWVLKNLCPFDLALEIEYLVLQDHIDRKQIRSWVSWGSRLLGQRVDAEVAEAMGLMFSVEQVRAPFMFLFYCGIRRYRTIHNPNPSMWRFHAPEE